MAWPSAQQPSGIRISQPSDRPGPAEMAECDGIDRPSSCDEARAAWPARVKFALSRWRGAWAICAPGDLLQCRINRGWTADERLYSQGTMAHPGPSPGHAQPGATST